MMELQAGPVRVRDWGGGGAPILLVHGMAANTHWWDPAAPLWGGALRAAALDLRGHGESAWIEDGHYAPEAWVADIESARRALGWERMILCGHSLGGRLVLAYAAAHPERLRGVAAVDFIPELRKDRSSRFARARGRLQPVYESEERLLGRFRLEPEGTLLGAAALRELGRSAVRRGETGWTWKFDWRCLGTSFPPVWPILPSLRVPALVARGELSVVMNREELARVAAALPGARAVEIPGAHHHVPLDAPRALAAAIAEFAASLNP
ncbi:MAG: alpha/beta hydrolase [Elusimicrobia bacterium]|nr:alpha/beta hydrolase [Elusimicrobiota bacterium]